MGSSDMRVRSGLQFFGVWCRRAGRTALKVTQQQQQQQRLDEIELAALLLEAVCCYHHGLVCKLCK